MYRVSTQVSVDQISKELFSISGMNLKYVMIKIHYQSNFHQARQSNVKIVKEDNTRT